jgi:hypothetical protein
MNAREKARIIKWSRGLSYLPQPEEVCRIITELSMPGALDKPDELLAQRLDITRNEIQANQEAHK